MKTKDFHWLCPPGASKQNKKTVWVETNSNRPFVASVIYHKDMSFNKELLKVDRYFLLRYNDLPPIQRDAIPGYGVLHFIRLFQLSFNFVLIALHKSQRIKACGGQLIMAFVLEQRRRFVSLPD